MKIALVNPRYSNRRASLPMGLAYIAATLCRAGHEVVPILMDVDRSLTVDDVAKRVAEEHFEVLATGGLVTRYKFLKELSCAVERHCPEIPLVVGGKLADSIPDRVMENTTTSVLCFGEGEFLIVEVIEALEGKRSLDSVAGIAFRENGQIKRTANRPIIDDLDSIPRPAYDLFPIESYNAFELPAWEKRMHGGAQRIAMVQTNRGCPFTCSFCRRAFEPRVRMRSVDSIISELEDLKARYDFQSIRFNDELTLLGKKRTLELSEGLRKANLGMTWNASARVDLIDREMLLAARESGCISLSFGIESGNQRILNEMEKRVTVEQAREALRLTVEAGIVATGTYIIGMPGETRDSVRDTIEFMSDTGVFGTLFFATAYPGTTLWDQALAAGKIPDVEAYIDQLEDASDYVVNLTAMSDEELLGLARSANEEIMRASFTKRWGKGLLGYARCARRHLVEQLRNEGLQGVVRKASRQIGHDFKQVLVRRFGD